MTFYFWFLLYDVFIMYVLMTDARSNFQSTLVLDATPDIVHYNVIRWAQIPQRDIFVLLQLREYAIMLL